MLFFETVFNKIKHTANMVKLSFSLFNYKYSCVTKKIVLSLV
jgi:hypothetical protein